jgi:signal transduction histidine kinase
VNTSSSAFSRVGIGLFSTMLGLVLLLMVAALLTADRALTAASTEAAKIDATESAHVIQQRIVSDIEAVGNFRGLLLSNAGDRQSDFDALAESFVREHDGVKGVWVSDSSGRVLFETGGSPLSAGTQNTVQLSFVRNGVAPELVLMVPFVSAGRLRGAIGARFDRDRLLAPVTDSEPQTRARFVLVDSGTRDTILDSGAAHEASLIWQSGRAVLPNGVWKVSIAHAQTRQGLRITLWTLGLVAVIVLGVGVLRERRQALRVAERSAELERLSSELLRANRMKSEFLANVSHELRTPLNAIVGFVDLLRDGVYGDLSPRQTPPVERIAASATHLRHLVDQVLDIAKIAAGRLEVHAETIVLRPFVLNVVSELEPLITERGLSLSIAIGASLPRVRTDPTHLRQILVNLIGNAIKYTPAGGIAVRARLAGIPTTAPGPRRPSPEDPTLLSRSPDRRKTWIALQVIDTGIGISPADQERIFDEFEQVNAGPRTDSMERGTGLGLAISRRLARLLGGDIAVDSQLGKGSTFTIWLPISPADLPSGEPVQPVASTPQATVSS